MVEGRGNGYCCYYNKISIFFPELQLTTFSISRILITGSQGLKADLCTLPFNGLRHPLELNSTVPQPRSVHTFLFHHFSFISKDNCCHRVSLAEPEFQKCASKSLSGPEWFPTWQASTCVANTNPEYAEDSGLGTKKIRLHGYDAWRTMHVN